MQSLVDRSDLAGVATLVWRKERVLHASSHGVRDLDTGHPVERDTIFRIASMSKPITTAAALMLLDEGRFTLDEPIVQWAPEFATMRVLRSPVGSLDDTDTAQRPITFGDLLTHRAGFTYGDFWPGPIGAAYAAALGGDIDSPVAPDDWIAALASLPLIDQPGVGFHYGRSTDLLGLLVARIDDAPLGDVLARRIFQPLGMRDTGFTVAPEARHRRAAGCGFDDGGRPASRRAGPGGSFVEERPAHWSYVSGGQGLWSTLDDYLAFARLFVGDGEVDGVRLLRPETLALMTSSQLTEAQRRAATMFGMPLFGTGHGYGMGVAVVVDPDTAAPELCRGHAGTVGWPGAFGGWWQADPRDGSVFILLSHCMVELSQLAQGIGLGAYAARATFRDAASALVRRSCAGGEL
jgi:CubicO group peptidase (beta-lactamase class C family)